MKAMPKEERGKGEQKRRKKSEKKEKKGLTKGKE